MIRTINSKRNRIDLICTSHSAGNQVDGLPAVVVARIVLAHFHIDSYRSGFFLSGRVIRELCQLVPKIGAQPQSLCFVEKCYCSERYSQQSERKLLKVN